MRRLRILIAADEEVRRGLRALVEAHRGWEICAEAGNGHEAVDRARETKPDIVVLNIAMPGLNGPEAARQILGSRPKTRVILTMDEPVALGRDVPGAGPPRPVKAGTGRDPAARAETFKPSATSIAPQIALGGLPQEKKITLPAGRRLSARERKIIELLAEEKSHEEIASSLSMSVREVEKHCSNVMRKLDLSTASDLTSYAVAESLLRRCLLLYLPR